MTKTVLLAKPASVSSEELLERHGLAGADWVAMSNVGRALDLDAATDEPRHMFATGARRFDLAIVAQQFPVLYGNDFTLAWLARITRLLAPGGALLVEYKNPKRNETLNLVTAEALRARLPDVTVEGPENGVIRIAPAPKKRFSLRGLFAGGRGAAPSPFKSIYPAFEDKFDAYAAMLTRHGQLVGATQDEREAEARQSFVYALFGANQKSYLVERICAHFGIDRPVQGLDMGGGYGFMAAELCKQGHAFCVADYDPEKVTKIGPWLAKECGVGDSLTFRTLPMEEITEIEGKFDVIAFFGSLLYADRGQVENILAHAETLLTDGGLLIVHENPQDRSQPGSIDHEKKFLCADLIDYMTASVGPPAFFSAFSGAPIDAEAAAKSVMIAVSRKS